MVKMRTSVAGVEIKFDAVEVNIEDEIDLKSRLVSAMQSR
jgi:hypothetical protein